MPTPSYFRALTVTLAATFAANLTTPALAASEPSTRVVTCRSGSCLLITGSRAGVASAVSVNGHVVEVEGKKDWRVRLPVQTVREWSVPSARTIEVAFTDAATRTPTSVETDLPIGLLGHTENLASLVISMK
ncbi:MAG: hypothetical protein JWQ16_3020 [Novosphingobium sp.]|nr:hypothetical protein [Novosphingobium sp.]